MKAEASLDPRAKPELGVEDQDTGEVLTELELDRLSRKIGQLSLEIRNHADGMEIEQANRKWESLELLEKVYEKNTHIPVWPMDWKILWKFAAAQAVPLLALAGTSGQVINVVQAFLVSLP